MVRTEIIIIIVMSFLVIGCGSNLRYEICEGRPDCVKAYLSHNSNGTLEVPEEIEIDGKLYKVIGFGIDSKFKRTIKTKGLSYDHINLPETLEELSDSALLYFPLYKHSPFVFPSSVKKIGNDIIQCKEIVLPKTLRFICENSLSRVENFNSIIENDTIVVIFPDTKGKLVISDSIKHILPYAFAFTSNSDYSPDAYNIKEIVWNSKMTKIPSFTFYKCRSERIVIPDQVTVIEDNAFLNSDFKKVEISENSKLKRIGERAFANCAYLESFLIPPYVKKIGEEAFYSCSSLKNVRFVGYEIYRRHKAQKALDIIWEDINNEDLDQYIDLSLSKGLQFPISGLFEKDYPQSFWNTFQYSEYIINIRESENNYKKEKNDLYHSYDISKSSIISYLHNKAYVMENGNKFLIKGRLYPIKATENGIYFCGVPTLQFGEKIMKI